MIKRRTFIQLLSSSAILLCLPGREPKLLPEKADSTVRFNASDTVYHGEVVSAHAYAKKPEENQWHHLMVIWDRDFCMEQVYVDGKLISSKMYELPQQDVCFPPDEWFTADEFVEKLNRELNKGV